MFKEHHPILFRQERVGKDLHYFKIFKIQTMVNGKVTHLGKYLRETGLDEVPQFINVLKGDMSIVGPRAITILDIKTKGWDKNEYSVRWSVRPGITGIAQLYDSSLSKASFFLDCVYIKNENILYDFNILCLTFLINIFGKSRILPLIFKKNKRTISWC